MRRGPVGGMGRVFMKSNLRIKFLLIVVDLSQGTALAEQKGLNDPSRLSPKLSGFDIRNDATHFTNLCK